MRALSGSCQAVTRTSTSAYAHPALPYGSPLLHIFSSDLQRASSGSVRPGGREQSGVKSKGTPFKGGIRGRIIGEAGDMLSAGAAPS